MPESVELIIKADNTQYVKSVNDAKRATQELHNSANEGSRRRLGFIEAEEKRIASLTELRRKAYDTKKIEFYNKTIQDSSKRLEDLKKAGLEVEKQTESLGTKMGKWALGIASVSTALGVLKKAFMDTVTGLNLVTIAQEAWTQVTYNMVTANTAMNNSLYGTILIGKEINALRVKERGDIVEIARLQGDYNKLYFESADRRKTDTERIQLLDQALLAHNLMVDKEIENLNEQKDIITKQLILRPKSNKLLDEEAAINVKLINAEASRWSGTKRIEAQRTALLQQGIEERNKATQEEIEKEKKYWTDYEKWFMDQLQKLPTTVELERERALETVQIANDVRDYLEKLDEDYFKGKEDKIKEQKEWWADYADWFMDNVDKLPTETEKRKEALEGLQKAFSETTRVIGDIINRSVQNAQRNRELLDNQIAETQRALEIETELYKAGYASNVGAKKKELAELEKQRALALRKEEEAIKKQKQLDTITQVSALITASAQTFKAFPGPLLPVAIAVVAAMFAAFAASKIKANETTKLAEGGSGTIKGKRHSQGGERFLDHVEVEQGEQWGVLSRRASSKYGDIFHNMVSSFNKDQMPEFITPTFSNNISVENNGPNSRLDQVNNNLKRLSRQKEEIFETGQVTIIRKGSNVRIIKR